MKFVLTVDMDNAAFEDNEDEVARILIKLGEELTCTIPNSDYERVLFDSNGNRVGLAQVVKYAELELD